MASRTFGVRSAGRRNFSPDDVNASSAIPNPLDSSNFGQLQNTVNTFAERQMGALPDPLRVDTAATAAKTQEPPSLVAADITGPITRSATDPMLPTNKEEDYYAEKIKELDKNQADLEATRKTKMYLELMDTGLDIVNSYSKHSMVETQNNYNILQSRKQLMAVSQSAGFAMLRAQSRATSRMEGAQLDAVARGQSSQGDVSAAMQNNEEAALAMDLINIELNAMQAAMGITQDIYQTEAETRISRANRDVSTINSLASAGITLL